MVAAGSRIFTRRKFHPFEKEIVDIQGGWIQFTENVKGAFAQKPITLCRYPERTDLLDSLGRIK
jgi:hypothetical protein